MAEQPTHPPNQSSPHGLGNRLARLAWAVAYWGLFRPSPRVLHFWRRGLLRLFGAKMAGTSRVFASARVWAPWNLRMGAYAMISERVDVYNVSPVTLGDRAAVSQYSFLCTASHDHEDRTLPLTHAPITLGADAWVAADVFVGPGVTIGEGTVVGARSSVFKDLPPWQVCVGNPARPVRPRTLRAKG